MFHFEIVFNELIYILMIMGYSSWKSELLHLKLFPKLHRLGVMVGPVVGSPISVVLTHSSAESKASKILYK